MAANNGSLLDEDGDESDWIELFNAGASPVNLGGWHLTDDAADLTQWTLPATNLAPGSFLVIFASGKNRAVAGAQLHANFALNNAGEYLALVQPDGVTVAHQYAPLFPPQIANVAYGIDLSGEATKLVGDAATARWRVPLSAADMPADWAATNFNAAAWSSGPLGLGFDGNVTNTPPGIATNLALGKPTIQSSTNGSFTPDRAVNGTTGDFTHTLAGANLPATWEVNLGTNYALESIILWNRSGNRSRLRDITVRVLTWNGTATNFTSALLNPENVLGGGVVNVGPTDLSLNLTQLTGGLVLGVRVRVTRTPDPDLSGSGGAGSTSEPDVLSLAEVEVFGRPATGGGLFTSLIRTDIGGAMTNVNASALLRVPFIIPEEELPVLDRLTLRMKYDDGFIAYLNGIEIARRNAPGTPVWNSAALTQQPDAAALEFEDIDVSAHIPLLQEGDNVLAIHALNASPNDDDLLIVPELIGFKLNVLPERYYAQPSPGTTNGGGYLGIVADTKFSVDRGLYDVPFTVAITSATAGAEIRYTTNGTEPSAVSGLVYTGPITINRTTALRAIATNPGWLSSNVDTHTYVFLSNVLAQSLSSATSVGFPANWPGTTPDYDMDPNVMNAYAAQMLPALRSLPSVFITASISNLFDGTHGIYTHPTQHGIQWERPASLELVGTNGQSAFQENCGLRIQGGAFRNFSFGQKKSFRVLFKGIYGAGKLRHDLFDDPAAIQEFDGLVFRAGGNDGYSWSSAGTTVQFTRDEFGRRLQLDMGQPAPRGFFVHLYLNGLYWGLYNLVERPNEDYAASYMGGEPEDWDSITSKYNLKSGDFAAWSNLTNQLATLTTHAQYQQLQGNHPDGSRNPALPVLYDKVNYMDYMLVNIWGGNWDWPDNNYWMARQRTAASTGFKFFAWDFENTMGNNRSRSPLEMVSPRVTAAGNEGMGVAVPHHRLKNYSEYRLDFADRVQRYFFNGGLLTPGALTNRYRQLADSVELGVIAETARWGDDNRTPAYTLTDWRGERDWILTNYLPQRTAIVLGQLRSAALFPPVSAPAFNHSGGAVPAEFQLELSHTNLGGMIFYTLDGRDPREPGTIQPAISAQSYLTPIALNGPAQVRARVLAGSVWSPIVEAVFYPPQDLSKLVLTEIMYQAPAVGATNGSEFDFLELKNTGSAALNLSGLAFTAGIGFTFTNGALLAPGEFGVLARNATAFAMKYPGVPLRGVYSGNLDNAGETLTLSHPLGATVFSVTYDDEPPWPVTPDGFGFSLVPVNPGASPAPDDGAKWRASAVMGGSPGADDPAPIIPPVFINEILAHTDPPESDLIELYNPNDDPVDLSGWFLSDSADTPKKYRIPNDTALPGGGYIYFDETHFNPLPATSNSFALSSAGEAVYLFSATTDGELTGYNHGVNFGASFNGVSFGRRVTSAGDEHFPALLAVTTGEPNAPPRVGPVVVNEIHYHPDAGGDEFVELLNITVDAVTLFDPDFPTNTWRLDGFGFTFPANVTLGPREMLLLVATNPTDFRAKYDVPAEVQIFGPVGGVLQDSGERLQLQSPDAPGVDGVPLVTRDDVRYNDQSPWPLAADGGGPSLQRLNAFAYGNDPVNWTAAAPTPGRFLPLADSDGDGLPDWWELAHGTQWDIPDAHEDLDGDGLTNWQEFLAGTHPTNSASSLRLFEMSADEAGFTFEFLAVAHRTYSVLSSATPDFATWEKLADVPAHTTNRMVIMTDAAPATATRFYLLLTPAQP